MRVYRRTPRHTARKWSNVAYAGPLFEIDSNAFSLITVDKLTLRVKATTANNRSIILGERMVDVWSKLADVPAWRTSNTTRDLINCGGYPNVPCNGDDWTYPTVVTWAQQLPSEGITIDDISNMNGGFFPPHTSHHEGLDIDANFAGYGKREEAAERFLVAWLRAHYDQVKLIFVTRTDRIRFNELLGQESALPDQRLPADVIQHGANHEGHFHIRLKSKTP